MISSTTLYGVVTQLVERYPEEVGVGGSSPSGSATSRYSITVIMPVFQTDDVSSILITCSFILPFRLMAGHVILVHSV